MNDLNKLRGVLQAKQQSSRDSLPPAAGAQPNDLNIEARADPQNKRVLIRINKHVNMIALDPAQAKSMITNLIACAKDIGIKIS